MKHVLRDMASHDTLMQVCFQHIDKLIHVYNFTVTACALLAWSLFMGMNWSHKSEVGEE
jgi:hypothetical protein